MVSRNFVGSNFFLSVKPPAARNSDLVVFGPLDTGHLEKFQARAENTKTQFPNARGTFGGEIRAAKKFLPRIVQFFYILCFGQPDRTGRKS